MSTSETLDLAADLIQERGWERGGGWPKSSRPQAALCLEGGLMVALGMVADYPTWLTLMPLFKSDAYRAMSDYLEFEQPLFDADDQVVAGGMFLYDWNDEEGRTAEEVIKALRACAAVERVKEDSRRRLVD